MNTNYCIIKSRRTGKLVVVSEVAKSKTKCKHITKFSILPLAFITALFSMTPLSAQAQFVCRGATRPFTDSNSCMSLFAEDAIASITNINENILHQFLAVQILGHDGMSAALTINDMHLITQGKDTGLGPLDIIKVHTDGVTGNATLNIQGTNSIIAGDKNGSVLKLDTHTTGTGDLIADIQGNLNITHNTTIALSGYNGIDIDNKGAGNAILSFSGKGNFDIQSGSGIFITANEGYIQATLGKDIELKVKTTSIDGLHRNAGVRLETIANGRINLDTQAKIITEGDSAYGIYTIANNGNTTIINSGFISTAGLSSAAISASATNTGVLDITNTTLGSITTSGISAYGMYASPTAAAHIRNAGSIITNGEYANGIRISNKGLGHITIENSGTIQTYAKNGHGILVETAVPNLQTTITNDGSIEIYGDTARGIITQPFADSSIKIVNNGSILHTNRGADGKYGIDAKALDNSHIEIENNGLIKGGDIGIVAWSGLVAHTGGESTINIGSTGHIEAYNSIVVDMSKRNTINIAQGGLVDAYNSAIYFREQSTEGQTNILNNAGTITSDRDIAVIGRALAANSTLEINNTGSMTGYVILQDEATTVNNSGIWDLRHFADTNGDRLRDVKSVAISNFGGGINTINNSGLLRLGAVSGESTTVTTGEYLPLGALSTKNSGIVQGQLLNVGYFENSGTIDLTGTQAGNVLVISGGGTAGSNGQGTFVANGGSIKLNTVLNEGGANSRSDILVVDNVVVGAKGATSLLINNAGGLGALTTGYGIKVVEVLGTSTNNAFKLGHTLIAGAYEYQLVNAPDQSWYLSSTLYPSIINPTPTWPNIINPSTPETPLYRPDIGINLGNQESITAMIIPGFNMNIGPGGLGAAGVMRSDIRLSQGSVVGQKSNSLWAFMTINESKYSALKGQIDYETTAHVLQIGGDRSFEVGRKGLLVIGLMANASTVDTKSINRLTGSRAEGSVDGYGIGAYATWFFNKENILSPYVDSYLIYGRYDNEVSTWNNPVAKYKSNAWSFTLQGGYPIALTSTIALEPQAQLTYVDYSSSSYRDHSGTRVSQRLKNNLVARVGTYIYGHGTRFKPYGALNLWYDSTHSTVGYLSSNTSNTLNRTTLASDKKGFIGEAKIGFQAEVSKRLTIWGEIGGRKGQNDYKDYGGSIGIKYAW